MAFGLGVNVGDVWGQSVPDRRMSQQKGLWWKQAPYHWGLHRKTEKVVVVGRVVYGEIREGGRVRSGGTLITMEGVHVGFFELWKPLPGFRSRLELI